MKTWRQKLNKVERSPAFLGFAIIAHAMLVLSVVGIMASVANKTAFQTVNPTTRLWMLALCIITLNVIAVRMASLPSGKDSDEA